MRVQQHSVIVDGVSIFGKLGRQSLDYGLVAHDENPSIPVSPTPSVPLPQNCTDLLALDRRGFLAHCLGRVKTRKRVTLIFTTLAQWRMKCKRLPATG